MNNKQGLGVGPADEMLAEQAWKLEFNPPGHM